MRKPRANDQTEYHIKQQVKRILTATEWNWWMPNAGAFGRSGVSDFLAVKKPKLFMAIETKYHAEVSVLQREFLIGVYEAGHSAFLVDETNVDVLHTALMSRDPDLINQLMKWMDQPLTLNQ